MNDNPTTAPTVVKFFLRNGTVVDWPIPDPAQFNFVFMCKTVRADGALYASDLYIPHDQIACIGYGQQQISLLAKTATGRPN